MADNLSEWILDVLHPERRRKKLHAYLRKFEEFPPGNPKISDLFHKALRSADDKMLGQVWREWKEINRIDLALEAEREMERRKAHSVGRN